MISKEKQEKDYYSPKKPLLKLHTVSSEAGGSVLDAAEK